MFFTRRITKAALALSLMASASVWAAGGYVYDAVGEVTAATGKNAAQRIAKNSVIVPDTMIKTGDKSYAVLRFEDGQVVTLQANSTFQVRKYFYDPKQADKNIAVFSMFKGGMRFITGLIGQQDKKAFRLATPNATIGIRGTEFMVAVVKGAVYSQVVAGSIRLTNDAGTSVFNAGQSVVASSAKSLPTAIPAAKLPPGTFSQLESISTQSAVQAPSAPQAPAPAGPAVASAAIAPPTSGVGIPAGSPTTLAPTAAPSILLSAGGAAAGIVSGAASPAAASAGTTADMPATKFRDINSFGELSFSTPSPGTVSAPASDAALTAATGTGKSPAITREEAAAGLFGKHNFTATGIATGEICAFCHAPQGAEIKVAAPLWNRSQPPLSSYKAFSTLGSATAASSGSVSMACLSCHDGTQAPNVVLNNATRNTPEAGNDSTDSRLYLKGHHPVGIQYGGGGMTQAMPGAPNRLDDFRATSFSGSGTGTVWWVETSGVKGRQKNDLLLFTRTDTPDDAALSRPYVECASCHDPHNISVPTFLRTNTVAGSALCLTCHAK